VERKKNWEKETGGMVDSKQQKAERATIGKGVAATKSSKRRGRKAGKGGGEERG